MKKALLAGMVLAALAVGGAASRNSRVKNLEQQALIALTEMRAQVYQLRYDDCRVIEDATFAALRKKETRLQELLEKIGDSATAVSVHAKMSELQGVPAEAARACISARIASTP